MKTTATFAHNNFFFQDGRFLQRSARQHKGYLELQWGLSIVLTCQVFVQNYAWSMNKMCKSTTVTKIYTCAKLWLLLPCEVQNYAHPVPSNGLILHMFAQNFGFLNYTRCKFAHPVHSKWLILRRVKMFVTRFWRQSAIGCFRKYVYKCITGKATSH